MQVSLQALKAFESAARLGSFKLAAEELSLTPMAISHHISNLEGRLSVSLFHRHGRRIALTGTGARLAKATSEGFRKIDNALDEVMRAGTAIRVTTTSSLAAMALIPAQHEFEQANPGISLEISTGESVDSQSYILPVRYGDAARVEPSDIIRHESFNVFGAPGMAAPGSWNEGITLFTTQWKNTALPEPPLTAWLEENRLQGAKLNCVPFDQELFGIQQAMAGRRLVFCSTTLAKRLVDAKLLQSCDTREVASSLCYYVPNKNSFETRGAVRFLEWVDALLNG